METKTTEKVEYLLQYRGKKGEWIASALGPCKSIAEAMERGQKIGFDFSDSGLARIRLRHTVVTTSVSEEIIAVGDMGRNKRSRVCRVKKWRIPEGMDT